MRYGLFLQPSHPPERDLADAVRRALDQLSWADDLGFSEAWIGEHLTAAWEPIPAQDLVIAQALLGTERIVLGAGGYVLPYYHPAPLAMRIMQLDHMAQGRFMCGIAAGSIATDFAMLDIDPMAGDHRAMTRESLEIMMRIWTTDPRESWTHEGRFWTVTNPEPMLAYGPHLQPFQRPHPPLALAGLSPHSETLRLAGELGAYPLSLTFNTPYLAGHWDVYEQGAAAGGHRPDRDDWRVIRDVFVADTDEDARRWVKDGNMARAWAEQNFPTLHMFDWVQYLKHDEAVADADVDLDYLLDHLFLVGDPDTVAARLARVHDELGGFGTVIATAYDWGDDPSPYRRSLELFATEVIPRFEALTGTVEAGA